MTALLIGLLYMIGCAGREPDTKPGKPRVALIMKSLANEFFVTMADGARTHQQEHAETYDLIVNGIKDESDLSQQVALVEQTVLKERVLRMGAVLPANVFYVDELWLGHESFPRLAVGGNPGLGPGRTSESTA